MDSESRLLLQPLFSLCISVCTIQNVLLSEWLFELQEGWRDGGWEEAVLEMFMMWVIVWILEDIHAGKITSVSFLLGCWRSCPCFPQHLKPFSLQDFALMFVNF